MTHPKQEEARATKDNAGEDQYLHVLYFVEENQLMFVPSCIPVSCVALMLCFMLCFLCYAF